MSEHIKNSKVLTSTLSQHIDETLRKINEIKQTLDNIRNPRNKKEITESLSKINTAIVDFSKKHINIIHFIYIIYVNNK